MRLFNKERESLQIRRAKASRAIFLSEDIQEVEVKLETVDGEELTLRFDIRTVPGLIGDLSDAYEAIHPPLSRRRNSSSQWAG